MAHAVRFHEVGGPDVLRWEQVEPGRPAAGQVRIRQTAVGVNYIDVYHRTGLYPVAGLPSGLGLEAAGVVEEVGPGVTGLSAGDRVAYGLGPIGAYAEERVVPAAALLALPAGLDERTAAAALLKGMTAQYLVRRTFRVEPGMPVLFHAAAGGTGVLACQWLAALGAEVIGTVGSEEKAAIARRHGCRHVIVTSREDFVARVREITGGAGVPVVYDGVGRDTFAGSLACLSRRGLLVSFGNASGPVPAFEPRLLAEHGSLFLTRPKLHDHVATRAELEETAAELFGVLLDGRVRVEVGQTFPLRDAARAHRALEARRTHGSTLLLP